MEELKIMLPNTLSNDFYFEVNRGNITGFSTLELVGVNAAVGGTEDIWNSGASISQVSSAAVLNVSSSDATDIDLAVTITGLDANYDEITEVITTAHASGQTKVTGTQLFLRVNSVTIASAPAGKVYVYYADTVTAGVPDTASKIQSVIDIAATRSYNAIYTVPRNKNLYLTSIRYRSTGSTTAHDVIISLIQKLYGGSNATVSEIKYVDLATTNYTDEQVSYTDKPIIFPAKSEIRFTAGLAGGTALNISLLANFIVETIEVLPTTVAVINKTQYLAQLTALTRTLASQNYYLIGLDEYPTEFPATVNLEDTLTTITGDTLYTVAADTCVAFDPNYFTSGKLIVTTKPALLTIMRCVDSAAAVTYVYAPVNTLVNLKNVKTIKYLTA